MDIRNLALIDLAVLISDHLRKNEVETVLSGGACVSIYTNIKYIYYDLDFVLVFTDNQKKAKKALDGIGFYEEDRYFKHKDTEFFVDFISPPLSVGSEPVKEISEIKKGNRTLKLLSVTDCVKDRLAAFYHWDDKQALDQAVLVARDNPVDFREVERWSKNQGMLGRFKMYLTNLEKK